MTIIDDRPPCIRRCVRFGTENDLLPARHGAYCHRCYTRTEKALKVAPELIAHLVHQYEPSTSRQLQEVYIAPSDASAKAPFNTLAFDAANDLYRTLVYVANRIAKHTGLKPPAAAERSWRDTTGQVLGVPAGATPEEAALHLSAITAWLLVHLEDIYQRGGDTLDDLDPFVKDTIFGLAKSWPRENRARYSDMPHITATHLKMLDESTQVWAALIIRPPEPFAAGPEGCGGQIALYPPQFDGDEETIQCETCETLFDHDEYAAALAEVTQVKRNERNAADRERRARNRKVDRSEQVRQHLIGKYVTPTTKENAS